MAPLALAILAALVSVVGAPALAEYLDRRQHHRRHRAAEKGTPHE